MNVQPLALVGGAVHSSADEPPLRDGVVLVKDGKIVATGPRSVAVPFGFEIIDCSGCTIVPGLWNSHVHFFERKWAAAAEISAPELGRQLQDTFSRYGFTNAFDLSSPWENTRSLRERIESGEVAGPRIRSTGEGLVSPGALPPDTVMRMMGVMPAPMPEIADVAQAVTAAKALLKKGADGIKLFVQAPASSGSAFSVEIVSAVAQEAHRAGKRVFAHPATGRIHADFFQLGSEAGRASCRTPNLQQIPHAAEYRACFRAPEGRVLVGADYSQIEPRIAAEISGEERLLAAACRYSACPHIALLSAAPPGAGWRRLAQRYRKKWVHLPLSQFSDATIQQLRMVHVLNGRQVRSYAVEFIRKA